MSKTAQPLLGRCKHCDFALFADRDQVQPAGTFNDIKLVGVPYLMDGTYFARCPKRHKVFKLQAIKGTFSETHKCDIRCLNAKGHECTCSCGGMNHGRGYAVEAVEASAPVIVQANSDEATDKQLAFIRKLMGERLDGETLDRTERRLDKGLTKRLASQWIEKLLAMPDLDEPTILDADEGDHPY